MADLSIMYQPLAGGWVKLGTQHGGGRGVVAESIRLEGDRGEGGCLSCSFKLKQDPRWIQTEMEKATPIVVMDGAEAIWSGRIAETPMTFGEDDIEVGVNAQGWWQHMKDDCTDREWVISDLSRWVDIRTQPNARLLYAEDASHFVVNNANGYIQLALQPNQTYATNSRCGVTIDLGANNTSKTVSVDYTSSNNSAGVSLYCYNHSTAYWADATNETGFGPIANNAGASGTQTATFTTTRRYVTVFMYVTAGGATGAANIWFNLTGIRVFTDSADASAGASILKASTVISETLDACAPLISADRSRITTTSLSLPQFPGSPGWRYADELIKQANAPHGYLARLTPDPVPVFEYSPIPTDYRFVLGEGQYTLLEPAAQALQGVASRVITEYEDASGVRSYAEADVSDDLVSSPVQVTNPSATVDTSNWSGGSLSRDTGTFQSTPASFRVTTPGYGAADLTQRPTPGKKYTIRFYAKGNSATTIWVWAGGDKTTNPFPGWAQYVRPTLTTSWALYEIELTWPSNISTDGYSLTFDADTVTINVDDIQIFEATANLIDRRGFRRTFLRPMTQRSTLATAQAISDLELADAQFPPFKGTIGTVGGRIPLKGGGSMDVSHLPACVGDNILLGNLHDPNTQGLGRIGNIQSVVYDHDKRQAIIGIDRDLSFITELRNRLSLFAR